MHKWNTEKEKKKKKLISNKQQTAQWPMHAVDCLLPYDLCTHSLQSCISCNLLPGPLADICNGGSQTQGKDNNAQSINVSTVSLPYQLKLI